MSVCGGKGLWYFVTLWLCECLVRGSIKPGKRFREMTAAHGGGYFGAVCFFIMQHTASVTRQGHLQNQNSQKPARLSILVILHTSTYRHGDVTNFKLAET